MTNPCTCKAEHWQTHAESCPAYKPRPLLTVENIRSGAIPADAVVAGFLLGQIERLKRALRNCADYADYPQDGADIGRKVRLNGVADVCAVALRGSLEPCEQRAETFGNCLVEQHARAMKSAEPCGRLIFAQHCQKPKGHEGDCEWAA